MHTPGPWVVGYATEDGEQITLVGLPDRRERFQDYSLSYAELHVARVCESGAEGDANAHLIAAAPDLLAALEEIGQTQPLPIVAIRAIAKAHGIVPTAG